MDQEYEVSYRYYKNGTLEQGGEWFFKSTSLENAREAFFKQFEEFEPDYKAHDLQIRYVRLSKKQIDANKDAELFRLTQRVSELEAFVNNIKVNAPKEEPRTVTPRTLAQAWAWWMAGQQAANILPHNPFDTDNSPSQE